MFSFDLTDELRIKARKLAKKDKRRAEILNKKIREIISNDLHTIDRYKNLRHDLKEHKMVHVNTHFVLTFRVDKRNNFILFVDFDHHDRVYG